jgi:3-phosphoshikimate 1-carboxyvinyltransferase
MIEIKPARTLSGEVAVPGSKSFTHRMLIAAALSDGTCEIVNPLISEDTALTRQGLSQMGILIEDQDKALRVHGGGGTLKPSDLPIYLGNSGTSMRLLTAVAALGTGTYTLTGTSRMAQRPIQDLVDALLLLGIRTQTQNNTGCPPVIVSGGNHRGGQTRVKCGVSSQYLSALLLVAPCMENGLDIYITQGPVSKPYIDMTVDIMEKMGIQVFREGYERFAVPGNQPYRHGRYVVEPDCSQAGYFWAAAAITGQTVKVKGIPPNTRQGDVRFVDLLERMGCRVSREDDGIAVTGGPLVAVKADMADMPDIVPTLAVIAAFAEGTTVIENVAHLQAKESDRLAVTAHELSKMGIKARGTGSGLLVHGGTPRGAVIDPHDDHRMAMSFALAGLKIPGIFIENETCVQKSFPDYWKVLDALVESRVT